MKAPTPWTIICSGLDAVTLESFWRSEPEAEFLGLANGALPRSIRDWFNLAKSSRLKNTSPRTSTTSGMSLPDNSWGIPFTVITFRVTSSPTLPSPRVAAETSLPFSYLRLMARPSIFNSQRNGPPPVFSSQLSRSSIEKTLSRLIIFSK